MRSPKPLLEWEFSEELDQKESSWSPPADPHDNRIAEANPDRRLHPNGMVELLVGVAIIYGIAVYLIWEQSAARITVVEQELVLLRQAVLRRPQLDQNTAEKQETIALAQQIVATAVAGGKQKAQWRPVRIALQLYLKREIDRPGWQQEEAYLANRRFATTHSLHLVQQVLAVESGQSVGLLQHMSIADVLADPLIEFILNTFGYARLPALLQAFEEHETWETLVPAVYVMSAQEFEETWHAYLEERYPTSKPKSETVDTSGY